MSVDDLELKRLQEVEREFLRQPPQTAPSPHQQQDLPGSDRMIQEQERGLVKNNTLWTSRLPTVHATQLPEVRSDSPLATEWNFYRTIVGRLLAEGHEGKWILIKNEEIVGIWDTEAKAVAVHLERFAEQPVLLKQLLAREPILRIGYNRLVPNQSRSRACQG
jgi:hypothetical protein